MKKVLFSTSIGILLLNAACQQPSTAVEAVIFADSHVQVKHQIMGLLEAGEVSFKHVSVNMFNKDEQVFTTEIINSAKAEMNKDSLYYWSSAMGRDLNMVLKDTQTINAYHFVFNNPEWDTSITIMKDSIR